jgi:hypothetical protein
LERTPISGVPSLETGDSLFRQGKALPSTGIPRSGKKKEGKKEGKKGRKKNSP